MIRDAIVGPSEQIEFIENISVNRNVSVVMKYLSKLPMKALAFMGNLEKNNKRISGYLITIKSRVELSMNNSLKRKRRINLRFPIILGTVFLLLFSFLLVACASKNSSTSATAVIPMGSTTNAATQPADNFNGTSVVVSGSIAAITYGDLVKTSSLVVSGTVSNRSDVHLIRSADGGDPICFTDYYFDIDTVYRGESYSNEVIVRMMGGTKGDYRVTVEDVCSLVLGNKYILFLEKPNTGGGWNTKGDYYQIVGVDQGAFYFNEDGTYHSDTYNKVLDLNSFVNEMIEANVSMPIDYDYYKNYGLKSLESNYKNGMITEEMYKYNLELFNVYAEIIE